MLLDDVLSDWWELHKKSIKSSTEKTMVYAVDEVKESFAPGIKTKNIAAKYARQYFTDSEDNHIKLKKHKSVLSMFFKYAQDLELIDSNPIQRVRLPKQFVTYEKLHELRKNANPNYKDMGFIFVSSSGIPIHKSSIGKLMKNANATLKKPINKPLRPYILRHILISTLAENNIPLKAITQRVGHKDNGKTTMEIYTHVTKNIKSKVVDVLDKLYK